MQISAINSVQGPHLTNKEKAATGATSGLALTAGVLYAAKKGKLAPNQGGNLIAESAKTVLRTYANTLNGLAKGVSTKFNSFLVKHPTINKAVTFVADNANKAKNAVESGINTARTFAAEKIEKFGNFVAPAKTNKPEQISLF